MHEVAVVLSTYNGSRFIKEQIDSILNQKDVHTVIYIRDDGSTDDTVSKIRDTYKDNADIRLEVGENIGVGPSFMACLCSVVEQYDYYCFSDQDDIWLEDKLISAITALQKVSGPVLYSSNQFIADTDGNKTTVRYSSEPEHSYARCMCSNRLSGCTFVWNSDMNKILSESKRRPDDKLLNIRIHDVWVALAAHVAGTVIYDEDPHILYRVHDKNYVGVSENHGIAGKISAVCHNIRTGKMLYRSATCSEFLKCFGDLMSEEELKHTVEHANYMKDSKIKRKLIKDPAPYFLADNESLLSYRTKIFLNLW